MTYTWDFGIVLPYGTLLLQGLGYTILFALGTIVLGLVVGLVFCAARMSKFAPLRWFAILVVEVFRCTPVLVQLVWVYYALPVLLPVTLTPWLAAIIVLSGYAGAFYGEIFRAGILSISTGQTDAGRALGFKPVQIMRLIVLPQAIKRMVPPFMNQSILQLKNTSLVSTIAVPDLLYQGIQITSATYRPLEVYTIVAVCYFVVLFPATRLLQGFEINQQNPTKIRRQGAQA
ncbi:amino acid ABC transporter permease [Ensifer sp. YR511]|uniref:amino acid ABC transporter permease n=1 Tax=Ensifer sp. YR511 TaxID=1855294 RepID=UPI0008844FA9|nr:amino acid ABC transporter permease [Ensifer sp. YR511]SDN42583.1 amino acid ABC transporter membrane protein, PAAT family [Ensifer sp. YR511]